MIIYTDGACSGNPGPGGWAFAYKQEICKRDICAEQEEKYGIGKFTAFWGRLDQTTNNQMELEAMIQSLIFLENIEGEHTVYTDSKYVLDGIKVWLPNWLKNNWLTAAKKPVKNRDYWEKINQLFSGLKNRVELVWVKGHAQNEGNIVADMVAVCSVNGHANCSCNILLNHIS